MRPGHFLEELSTRLGSAVLARPRAVVAVALVLATVAGALAGCFLRVRPGYVDLLDKRSPLQRRYLELLENFGNVETLYAVVEVPDEAAAERFIGRFADLVRDAKDDAGRPLASGVLDRVDPEWFVERLPALLPLPALEALVARDDLGELVADPSPARILDTLRASVDRAAAAGESGAPDDFRPEDLAGLASLFDAMGAAARGEPVATSSWLLHRGGQDAQRIDAFGHVRLAPGRYLVTVAPSDTANDYRAMAPFLDAVKKAARDARSATGVEASLSYTGAPALIVDEMRAVSRDVTIASLASVALVTLLFLVSFNSLRHVAFAGVANVAGLALTFGAAWLLVGYLNLFSSVFAAVLAGLGIDFGIHLINHFEAARRRGLSVRDALMDAYGDAVPAIATSAATTAAAFLAIMTSDFAGFAQLGLISGVGVLLCVVMSVTLVPAMLVSEERRARRPSDEAAPWSQRVLLLVPQRAVTLSIVTVTLALFAGAGLLKLRFDHDLMNLQPSGTEAVALQRAENRVSTHQAFSVATTLDEARDRAERFARLPSVASSSSAATFLPGSGAKRQELLVRLALRLASLAPASAREGHSRTPVDSGATLASLDALAARLQEIEDLAFEGGQERAVAALEVVVQSLARLRESVVASPSATTGLSSFRDDLAAELARMTARLPTLAAVPLQPRDLPAAIASHYVGKDGRLAVIVEPRESVWDRAALARFVDDLRTVDPEVSGPPIQVLEVTELMRRSLERAAWIAFGVIVVLTLVSMRSLVGTVLALTPLLLGFLFMLGLMGWLDVALNPANLVALPLLLGIGVDGGVHVAHRWLAVRDARRTVEGVGHPLLITSLTTVAGFLPLLFAHHRGIRSLGVVTCLGSVTMLLAAVVAMPAALALLDARARRSSEAA